MIGDLKPYPEYTDSGLPWFGLVPSHWVVSPLARLARLKTVINESDRQLLSVDLQRGVVRFSDVAEKRTNTTSEDLGKYQAVDPGDFVLNNQQAWRGSVGVSDFSGIVSPAYLVLALSNQYLPRYANSLFRDQSMVAQYLVCSKGVGTIQRNLYWPHLKRVGVIVPPPEEQAAIVRFLDWANGRLERAIRAKRKIIALLNEQKQAIIHRAVTRGLDPSVPIKPSGIPWIGEIPEHWEVQRLKSLASFQSGDGITSLEIEENGPYPVYGGNGMRGYTTRYTHDGCYALIGRQGALCGNLNFASGHFFASEHAVVPTLQSDMSVVWFGELLRAMNLNQYSQSAAQPGLAVERIKNLYAPVPPATEQVSIVKSLERDTAPLVIAITRLEGEIALLREYRTRLVADVVTGKLDVREAAAGLPEEALEEKLGADEIDEDLDAAEAGIDLDDNGDT